MYYQTCPDCGCNLDPGEKCDCKKEGLSRSNGSSPKYGSPTTFIIAQTSENVKREPLRELRINKKVSAKDMVKTVKTLFPKYDKVLQSKCERSGEYGIRIRPEAMEALVNEFAPEYLEEYKRKRRGGHRLTCRVQCRLEDEDYDELLALIREDGFDTVQAWLYHQITRCLATRKERKNNA